MKSKRHVPPASAAPEASEISILREHRFSSFARPPTAPKAEPSDDAIRDRAYLLYVKANRCDGCATEHWTEAAAQLRSEAAAAPLNPGRAAGGRA